MEGSSLNGNAIFQVLSTQHQHLIVVLEGYVDGPNRRVVPNACRIKVRVFKGILHGAPIAAIPDHFHDLVGERLFSLPLAQVAVSICCLRECNGTVRVHGNYRAAVGYTVMYARNLLIVIKLGQGCSWIIRASNYMEHTLLKRTCIGRIGILLLSNRRPHNLRGVVFVHECCLGRRRWWLYLLAVVGKQLLHFRSYRQIAGMAFVSNRYGNLIQCLRCTYAWVKRAQVCGFVNLVGIHARLGVGDVAEAEWNFSTIRRPFRLRYLHTRHALACAFRHRNVNGTFGGLQNKRELVGALPVAASENLLARKALLAFKRARCAIDVYHLRICRLTSNDYALKACPLLGKSSTIGLRNFIAPTAVKAVYVQRFACLQVVLCLALSVERQGKRVANLIAVGILHHSAKALGCGIGHINSELERIVCEVVSTVPVGHLQLLRYRQRAGEVNAQLAVVAQVGSNLARANPLRVQHVNGSPGIIRGFCLVKLVKIRQSSSTCLEVGTLAVHPDGALDGLGISAAEAYDLFLLLHGTATRISHFVVRIFVPIGITLNYLVSALSTCFIGVDGRVAGEVIVAVVL